MSTATNTMEQMLAEMEAIRSRQQEHLQQMKRLETENRKITSTLDELTKELKIAATEAKEAIDELNIINAAADKNKEKVDAFLKDDDAKRRMEIIRSWMEQKKLSAKQFLNSQRVPANFQQIFDILSEKSDILTEKLTTAQQTATTMANLKEELDNFQARFLRFNDEYHVYSERVLEKAKAAGKKAENLNVVLEGVRKEFKRIDDTLDNIRKKIDELDKSRELLEAKINPSKALEKFEKSMAQQLEWLVLQRKKDEEAAKEFEESMKAFWVEFEETSRRTKVKDDEEVRSLNELIKSGNDEQKKAAEERLKEREKFSAERIQRAREMLKIAEAAQTAAFEAAKKGFPETVNGTVHDTTSSNEKHMSTVPFFRIQKNDQYFYILGTDHSAQLKDLPDFVLNIIKTEIKSLLEESPSIKDLTDAEKMDRLKTIGFLTREPDNDWYKKLSEESLTNLQRCLAIASKKKHIQLQLSQINPALVLIFIQGIWSDDGIDDELHDLFQGQCFSLDVIADYNLELMRNTIEEVDAALKDMNEIEKSFRDISSYLDGTCISNETALADCEQDVNMLVNRNIHWLPKIIDFVDKSKDPILVAIGSDHLLGQAGILHLLKRCGYAISRINANGIFESYETITANSSYCPFIDLVMSYTLSSIIDTYTQLRDQSKLVTEYLGDLIANNPPMLNHFKIKRETEKPKNVELYFNNELKLKVVPEKAKVETAMNLVAN